MTLSIIDKLLSYDATESVHLDKRARRCYYTTYGRYRCTSTWSSWGRWLLVGLIIFFFLLFLVCACLTSRRRRSKGHKPYYGTGWMAPNSQNTQQYNAPPGPPPQSQYGPNSGVNNNGAAAGYYGGNTQETGYAPQKPEQTYAGGYAPPQGPPPNRY